MNRSRFFAFFCFAALLLAAWALRAPFLDRQIWNLDEGTTFTMSEQVLRGDVLYRDAADNRGPLMVYLKAAIFAFAGHWNADAVHLALALALGAAAFVLWQLARRLRDNAAGVGAAFAFTVLSFVMLDKGDALSANTGWFVALFSTFGFGAFVWSLARPNFFSALPAGFFFGCSFLCKQPALLDFGVTWVLLALLAWQQPGSRSRFARAFLGLLFGAALPVLAFVLYFAAHGAFADFRYYAFTYNTETYIPAVPRLQRLAGMADPFILVWNGSPALALLAAAAAAHLLLTAVRSLSSRPTNLAATSSPSAFPLLPWLILGWSAAGILSTGLSGRNFSHYSAQVVPGFSLAAGWALARLFDFARQRFQPSTFRRVLVVATLLVLVLSGFDLARRARELDPRDLQIPETGQLVQSFTTPRDRILIWGYFPEIYFFSQRLPATRFVYTNWVTGLVPWSNLDPLIDTTPTALPDGEALLAADWDRHRPALVVDTGASRGYFKYPLFARHELATRLRRDYAQVASTHADRLGVRLFRRLASTAGEPLDGDLIPAPSIVLSGHRSFLRHEPPRLHVSAPADAIRVDLYVNHTRVAAVDHPAAEPVDVLFFANPATPPGTPFHAVVVTRERSIVSPSFDFGAFGQAIADERPAGPDFRIDRHTFTPLYVDTPGGDPKPSPDQPDHWKITAPIEIGYQHPVGLRYLEFSHGLEMAAWGLSDGYDVVIEHRSDSAPPTRLFQKRLHPLESRLDREIQHERVDLPPLGPGLLVFRFLAGANNIPDHDWIYFTNLRSTTHGPLLPLANTAALPLVANTRDNHPTTAIDPGLWSAHSPARFVWHRPPSLRAIVFDYGVEAPAFAQADSHTDGVDLVVELTDDTGRVTHPLFSRRLEPFNQPTHRGPQRASIELPAEAPGTQLVLRVEPGPHGDASWDWLWLSDLSARETGPAIHLPDGRTIAPVSARELGSQPLRYLPDDRWGAHADAELIYSRPLDLASVTLRYGLLDAAVRDPDTDVRRSDGIELVVLFEPSSAPAIELFRRTLDPFNQPADQGEQTSTVTLPPDLPGRLVVRLLSGAANNNSYDWAYWSRFDGAVSSRERERADDAAPPP